jgi:hypothetical protein
MALFLSRPTWRPLWLLLVLACPVGSPVVADDKPAPLDRSVQSAALAVGHLCTQRPEGVLAAAVLAVRREAVLVGLMEFINLDGPVQGAIGATSMIGVRDGAVAIALYRHGANNGIFILPEASVARKVREAKIDKDKIAGIEDGLRIPAYKENPDEYNSYIYMIAHAHDVPQEALAKGANREITYAHLMEQPSRYRGEIVHITGYLKQLRKFDAPRGVWNDGIKVMYEGLIASKDNWAHRYYVILTEVPPGFKLGDKLDYPVTCDAYFFKRFFLENAKDGTRWRAPLLIGRSVVPVKGPSSGDLEGGAGILAGTPIGVVLTWLVIAGAFIGALVFLLRRSDMAVRLRLSEARTVNWVEPGNAPPEPASRPPGEEKPPG